LLRVVGQQWRHLQGYPAIDTIRPVIGGSKQVCCLGEVLKSQFKEQFFIGLAFLELLPNRGIIGSIVLIAFSKIVGFDVRPVTDSSSM
jgi:hypothetical protein